MRNKITYFLLLFSFISFGQNMYLDPTFGASGKLIDPFFTQNPVKIHFENNKYILIGGADSIICLNYDGSKDTTFGNNGIVVYNSSSTEYFIVSGSKLVNGFIYVYGQVQTSSSVNNDDIFLIKISTSGILDSSFGVNGIIRHDFSSKDILNDIIILNDGKILGIGSKLDSAAIGHMILIKYNSNGTIDTNFDPNGFKNLAVPQSSSSTASNILNFENNFLVVGQSYVVSSAHYDLVMIKMDENGNYIPTFGTNGVKKMAISTSGDLSQYWIMDAKLNGNGLYFIRGHIWSYLNQGNELLKYNLNTDTMETLIYLPRRSPFYAFDNNQKIYITGSENCSIQAGNHCTSDFQLSRKNSNGTVDTSFNSGGSCTYNFYTVWLTSDDRACVIYLHDDGKIFMAGTGWDNFPGSINGLAALRLSDVQLSVDENQFKKPSISPNPVKEEFHIENVNQPIKEVTLFDVLGKQVFISKDDSRTINIQSLQKGIYIAKINIGDVVYSIKIIKK